jgi:Methyltransferase domain
MDRHDVIQYLIDKKKYKRYLEIGVFKGEVFFSVKAMRKYAVDPAFSFTMQMRYQVMLKNPANIRARYFRKTSDVFFQEDAPKLFSKKKIDICFIDGMHEFEYALRDVENALQYLDEGGVIVLHDCNPLTAEATISFADWEKKNYAGPWNGDVWKTIVYLRSLRDDINVFTLDTDHGLGIVVKGIPDYKLDISPEQLKNFSYGELNANRKNWLNLKPETYLQEYFSKV